MTDTSIIAPSTNIQLSRGILGLESQIYAAAQTEVDRVSDSADFTAIEKSALLEGEALRMTNGLELGNIIIRGKIINNIINRGLARAHPNQYDSYREMATDCGLSISELSKTENLVNVVFPGLEALGFNIPQLWEQIGKSKFMDLIPYFRVLMTGEPSSSENVNQTIENLLDDIYATAESAGEEIDNNFARIEAIGQLVDSGTHLSQDRMRRNLRPERTELIETTYIKSNGLTLIIAEVDNDQFELFNRLVSRHSEPHIFELPPDPTARMLEASQIPAIIKVADLISIAR